MRIRPPLQSLPRERSRPRRNHARHLDPGRLPAVRREAALPADGHFLRFPFLPVEPETGRLGEAHQ